MSECLIKETDFSCKIPWRYREFDEKYFEIQFFNGMGIIKAVKFN